MSHDRLFRSTRATRGLCLNLKGDVERVGRFDRRARRGMEVRMARNSRTTTSVRSVDGDPG